MTTPMTIINQTNQDYWFGPLHLDAGVGETLDVDVTSDTSLYLTSDAVADAINNLHLISQAPNTARITVANPPDPFPRPTGTPQLLHGDGSPEGIVFAPQGSLYMRRDNTGATSSIYAKTTGVTLSTGWDAVGAETEVAPVGVIHQYAGATAPSGWLLCDGTAVSRTTYDALFAVCGTLYGSGDGTTTFNVPDLRGRVPVGKGTNAAVSTLGGNDGVGATNRRGTKHRHTPHSHIYDIAAGHDFAASGSLFSVDTTSPAATETTDGGSGVATDPLDGGAYLVVNYIIKT